ncbi:MAG TPA: alpha/beta hydrolase [Ktedonobacterales bacterium]|nr:alpha/beta hydrolase [Ktedonobacterales bacterium]
MTTAAPLDTLHELSLPQGALRYSDQGTGPTLVFIHGLLANTTLWSLLTPHLASQFRCIAPELPLGAHALPMHPDVDLTPPGIAALVADFLQALDLHDVTLVGNNTGGAICQLVIAHHPERIARLVLTNCDAFEQFFPPSLAAFQYGARLFGIGFANFLAWALRSRFAQRRFLATVSHRRPGPAELDAAFRAMLRLPGVRRDVTRFLKAVSNRHTLAAARAFPSFRHPVLLVWGKDDIFFSSQLAHRLQAAFPNAALTLLPNSRAFVPLDQPEALAQHITEFVHAAVSS